ncbi:MAG: hypothetical protein AAF902_08085 [Chloroflexota bacterium]
MWQHEVSNYHDETYYLFNDAMNTYLSRLQKIHNRGMIESWIEEGTTEQKSLWTENETVKYLQSLPYPENDVERKIWLAGFSSTRIPSAKEEIDQKQKAAETIAEQNLKVSHLVG